MKIEPLGPLPKWNYKTAIVSGVSGQDGSFLVELLLKKGYKVIGLMRRLSIPNTYRIED